MTTAKPTTAPAKTYYQQLPSQHYNTATTLNAWLELLVGANAPSVILLVLAVRF